MTSAQTDAEAQLHQLLHTVRDSLHLSAALLTRLHPDHQELIMMDAVRPVPPLAVGATVQFEDSFCVAMLAGRLPAVIPDVDADPLAATMLGGNLGWQSFASSPITFSDGSVYGTLCAVALPGEEALVPRDHIMLDVLARAAAVVIEPMFIQEREHGELVTMVQDLLAQGGPQIVVQPIVTLEDDSRVGWEALSRFPVDWAMAPDEAFDRAHSVGLGDALEVAAIRRAAELLEELDGYLALNISAHTALSDDAAELLATLPVGRIVLELSEHDKVQDYQLLQERLAPFRERGLRLAIDDVGAGYSSLLHIVRMFPDVIKLDRAIVTGLADDPVRRTLVTSMLEFARGCGAQLVAEGVESADDVTTLRSLGVTLGQGWHLGVPGPVTAS